MNLLAILNETNSIKNEQDNEIVITIPEIIFDGDILINSSCHINSKCNTIISCKRFGVQTAEPVSIKNLTIKGYIAITKTTNFSLSNIFVKSSYSKFSMIISESKCVIIDSVEIADGNQVGIIVVNNSEVEASNLKIYRIRGTLIAVQKSTLKISNSELYQSGSNGIHASDQSSIEVQRCTISDTGMPGIFVDNSKCKIIGNIIQRTKQNSITCINSHDFVIEGNQISQGGATGVAAMKSTGLVLNNGFTDMNGNGVSILEMSKIDITSNKFRNSSLPAIVVASKSESNIFQNEIKNIKMNGISLREAHNVAIEGNEIDNIDCGISVSDSLNIVVRNSEITNCQIAAIESYNNSDVFVTNNIISDIEKYAFLTYTSGYIKAVKNKIENVKVSMSKLVYKGKGDFSENSVKNCPAQFECQTSSNYFFEKNGDFQAITNDASRVSETVKLGETFSDKNEPLCLKCNKNKRDSYLLKCGHKVYCKKCAEDALKNNENCPLCRFAIESLSFGYDASNNDLCIICMNNKGNCVILPCGHMGVCSKCLKNWLKDNNSCPICRNEPCFFKTISDF